MATLSETVKDYHARPTYCAVAKPDGFFYAAKVLKNGKFHIYAKFIKRHCRTVGNGFPVCEKADHVAQQCSVGIFDNVGPGFYINMR